MQKPNNYDATQASGDFIPVELGAHYLQIVGVREQQSKAGADMIVVAFDFARDDKQANYFNDIFNNNTLPGAKWPYQGTKYIMVNDQQGNCSRDFKTFCTCIERSNKGFVIDWDAQNFCAQFKNKFIGGVFGLVENDYNGNVTMRREIRWFCEYGKVPDQKMPAPKYLKNDAGGASSFGRKAQNAPNVSRSTNVQAKQAVEEPDIPF